MVVSVATVEPPPANSAPGSSENKPVVRKHSKVLMGWLLIVIIANLAVGVLYLLRGPAYFPSTLLWTIYSFGALVNSALCVLIFAWKRLAFYGLCVSAGIIFVLNILIGVSVLFSTEGLLGPVILYLLLRPEWNLFD